MDDASLAVGARVRALRQERGLSLTALADAAGIGKGSLSELENGGRNPTLATLYAIASPLGVPLGALLDFREGARVDGDGVETTLLHTEHGDGRTSEVYLLRVAAGVTRRSGPHSTWVVEQLVVLEGTCEVAHGDPGEEVVVTLGPGGTTRLPGDVPHRYTALGPDDVRAIDVIVTPW
ncbi:XRE family transcriptional regulator [Nocardioides nanhaiensis]|uniref:XRE family transcriptional regulator n=1 Tax=Nocardioides nanhaiensis TaxID=1476871 RepID=A0ABP8WVC1_9ACTN